MDLATSIQGTSTQSKPWLFRVVRVILLVVSIVTVFGDLSLAATTISGHVLIEFGGANGDLPLKDLPLLLQADLSPGGHGTLASADLSLRLVAALPSVIHAAAFLFATILLLRALASIRDGAAFRPSALRNWRTLSVVLLVGGIAQGLAATAGWLYLGSRIGLLFGTGLVSDHDRDRFLGGSYQAIGLNLPQWPTALLIGGVVALALAVAFRAGARFEREADGVV
jgi:hypothetical protein